MQECANCRSVENLTIHHIVPLAVGGTERATNKVILCWPCHSLAHGKSCRFGELVKAGMDRARKEGRARPIIVTDDFLEKVRALHFSGKNLVEMSKELNVHVANLQRAKKILGLPKQYRMRPWMRENIIKLLHEGESTRAIAKKFGFSQPRIAQIRKTLTEMS